MSKQVRTKTQELHRAQHKAAQRDQSRMRLLKWVGALIVIALVVAIAVVAVRAATKEDPPSASGEVVAPAAATSDGAIPVGEGAAPVTLEIYYDYMCPACGAFEAANGAEIDRLLEAGEVRILLRPISFLDEQSNGTEYSTRAANAVATVADGAPRSVWEFHRALYEAQPAEGTSGLTDEQISELAADAGAPPEVVDRFAADTYESWVGYVTDVAFDSGITGTPTLLIDGEEFGGDAYSTGDLTSAIESAAGNE